MSREGGGTVARLVFTLGGAAHAASALVAQTISSLGYVAEVRPDGGHRISRGDAALTRRRGSAAAERFFVSFVVHYAFGAEGTVIVRVDRDRDGAFLAGGMIGAAKSDAAYRELVDAIGMAATDAGIFRASQMMS